MVRQKPDVHRTVMVVDVERFGDRRRTNRHQIAVRDALYRAVRHAFDAAGISWTDCDREDRGDGMFILAPADIPKAPFIDLVPHALVTLLREHNATHPAQERIRLRMALHAGEVAYDEHGVTAVSINLAFRLLDAKPLKTALAESPGVLAVITSEWFFDEVVRHSRHTDPTTLRPVHVTVKETSTTAWISLPDHPYPPDTRHLVTPPRGRPTASIPPQAAAPSRSSVGEAFEPTAADDTVANHEARARGGRRRHSPRPAMPTPQLLPPDVTHFTGRHAELDQLDALLNTGAPTAMVISAIAGTAGMGKTALAVRWAYQVADRFSDGQLYVDLRGFDPRPPITPEQALDSLLRSLGLPGESIPHGLDAMAGHYRSLLAGRRMLVVLDNAATPEQVRPLLPASPTCLVLVTSRSRLSGLVARDGAHRVTLGLLHPDEAVTLLRAIVGPVRADEEPEAVAELAHRCAYLPLAVRIAAERVTAHPHRRIADLVTDLSREQGRLNVLATGDDETTAVRAVLSWSYRALTPEAARVFRLLGLHPGTHISLPAAAALTGTTPTEVRRTLDLLTGVHLLEESGSDRYTFHDLLRAYATERATTDSTEEERADAVRRVLEWYLHTTHAAFHTLYEGHSYRPIGIPRPDCRPLTFVSRDHALRWYDAERVNLMAATEHAADIGQYDLACQLPSFMTQYLYFRSRWADLFITHRIGLTAARRARDHRGEFFVHLDLGEAHVELEQFDDATTHIERALAIARANHYRPGEAAALQLLGYALYCRRRFDDAIDTLRQALVIGHEIDDKRLCGRVLAMTGAALGGKQRFTEALSHVQEGLTVIRTAGGRWEEAYGARALARIYFDLRRHDEAFDHFRQAVTHFHDIGHTYGAAMTLRELGNAQHETGRPEQARESWHMALAILEHLRSPQAAELRTRIDTLENPSRPAS